jgi:hypothetical protein
MHGDRGVIFLGTKAELQAAGFGVGAVFPGEPGGNKKKSALPACNGFRRIEVELSHGDTWLGEPSQTALPDYIVRASYLAEGYREVRSFESTQWPEVRLHRATWYDVYSGTMDALVAAKLASFGEFPGQPGCGKVRTTFGRDGKRVTVGSNTAGQEGNRTIQAAGKRFEVSVQVSMAEREIRHTRWSADFDLKRTRAAHEIAAMLAEHRSEPPRRHLRLVWSA